MIDIGIIVLIIIMFCYFYKKIEKLSKKEQVKYEPDEKQIKKQEEIRKHFENLMNYDEEQAMKRK